MQTHLGAGSDRGKLALLGTIVFIVSTLCVSGVIYNWLDVTNMLKVEGEYMELCHGNFNNKGSCDARDARLNLIYTVAVNVASVGTVVYGLTLDRWGPRLNAFSGALIIGIGYLLFGLSDSKTFDAFIPGYALMAFGGIGVFVSNFHVS